MTFTAPLVESRVRALGARIGVSFRTAQLSLRRRPPGLAVAATREALSQVALRRGFPLPRRRVRVAGRSYIDVTIAGGRHRPSIASSRVSWSASPRRAPVPRPSTSPCSR